LTWLPYYLQDARGFSGSTAGLISSVMPLVTAPAGMVVGTISDRRGSRRSIALWLVPLATVAIALIGFTETMVGLVSGLILYGLTGKLVLDPLLISMATENVDSTRRASVLGVLNFASTLGMVSAPALTGYLADVTGSFRSAFVVAVTLGLVATLTMQMTREDARWQSISRR
jgi:MFS family permease